MPEYYLRVSIENPFVNTVKQTKVVQYNLFSIYDKDRSAENVLKWMLEEAIRKYKLDHNKVLVEQFNKL